MKHVDAIIIGGGIAGVVSANVLTNLGYEVLLLEPEDKLGGTNGSFTNEAGDVFDFGYHTLDFNRSKLVTKLFCHVLEEQWRKFQLKRGIVVRGSLIPYNAELSSWPQELVQKIGRTEFNDQIAGLPTRDELTSAYGGFLADLAYDEILPSYPTLAWQLRNGRSAHDLMDQLYPWFFPRATILRGGGAEWRTFHISSRNEGVHEVLYPTQGGFGAFVEGIVKRCDPERLEVRTGSRDMRPVADKENFSLSGVELGSDRVTADHYYWCAPILAAASLFGLDVRKGHPQMLCLGSYAFAEPLATNYHEILIGDPSLQFNRVSLPGNISGRLNDTLQAEFSFPVDDYPFDAASWKDHCLRALVSLGVIPEQHTVRAYQQLVARKGFITAEDALRTVHHLYEQLNTGRSNVVFPYVGLEVDNINRIVPSVFRKVLESITKN